MSSSIASNADSQSCPLTFIPQVCRYNKVLSIRIVHSDRSSKGINVQVISEDEEWNGCHGDVFGILEGHCCCRRGCRGCHGDHQLDEVIDLLLFGV
ncbi:hypothetical protein AKJ16_DCAP24227 [Drosera capensis]